MASIARLLDPIARASARIFGSNYNPQGKKTGFRALRRPAIGERMASYYGYTEGGGRIGTPVTFVDERLLTLAGHHQRRALKGKVRTKKGQGKRAQKKNKADGSKK